MSDGTAVRVTIKPGHIVVECLQEPSLEEKLDDRCLTPELFEASVIQNFLPVCGGHVNIADDMKSNLLLVIDTNILVSALRSRLGASFALVQAIRAGTIKMACTPALFLEYEDVLKRPSQLEDFELMIEDIDDILNDLATFIVPVNTHYQWRPQLRDPSDEMVLEAAVNASAHAIVTFNFRYFGPAEKFGVHVLTPQQAFAQFRIQKPDMKGVS